MNPDKQHPAHQSPVCDSGTRPAFLMARGLEKSWGFLRPQSPTKTAAGLGTGRRRSGRRGAVESGPSLRPRRESLAHSSTERQKERQKERQRTASQNWVITLNVCRFIHNPVLINLYETPCTACFGNNGFNYSHTIMVMLFKSI